MCNKNLDVVNQHHIANTNYCTTGDQVILNYGIRLLAQYHFFTIVLFFRSSSMALTEVAATPLPLDKVFVSNSPKASARVVNKPTIIDKPSNILAPNHNMCRREYTESSKIKQQKYTSMILVESPKSLKILTFGILFYIKKINSIVLQCYG
jgi:hypothetical protein